MGRSGGTKREGEQDQGEASFDDYWAALTGRASATAVRRVRQSLETPTATVRHWLDRVEEYAREQWQVQHSPDWLPIYSLMAEYLDAGKITPEQFTEITHDCPQQVENRLRDLRGYGVELTAVEVARLAERAVDRLKAMVPSEAGRIDAAVDAAHTERWQRRVEQRGADAEFQTRHPRDV